MTIRGTTRVAGLFGYPVEHSLSPAMHNAAFGSLGLDWCYVTFPVHPDLLGDAVKAIGALGLGGVNVTVPHKEKVMAFLDRIDDEAAFIGAVNTITRRDGVLTGYNTDGRGFMKSLEEAGISAAGRRILIIGTGGAARAIGYYLCKEAAQVSLFDIDTAKAEALTAHLNTVKGNASMAAPDALKDKGFIGAQDIIINATPLGLKPGDPLPIDGALLAAEHTTVDLIYKETPFLAAAAGKGCRTMHGLGMLLWQGVIAFELWTGIRPPADVMRNALIAGMAKK